MCRSGIPRGGSSPKLVAARLISGIDVDTTPNKQPLMNQKAAKDPVVVAPINNSRRLSWIPKTSQLQRLPLSDTRITRLCWFELDRTDPNGNSWTAQLVSLGEEAVCPTAKFIFRKGKGNPLPRYTK